MSSLTGADREVLRLALEARHRELTDVLERELTETPAVAPDAAIGRLTRVDAMQMGHMTAALRRQAVDERMVLRLVRVRPSLGRPPGVEASRRIGAPRR